MKWNELFEKAIGRESFYLCGSVKTKVKRFLMEHNYDKDKIKNILESGEIMHYRNIGITTAKALCMYVCGDLKKEDFELKSAALND